MHFFRGYLRLLAAFSLLSASISRCIASCTDETDVLHPAPGNYFMVSESASSFCEFNPEEGLFTLTEVVAEGLGRKWTGQAERFNLLNFDVNEEFTFAYVVTTDGMYYVDLPQPDLNRQREVDLIQLELPSSFDDNSLLRVLCVVDHVALIGWHDTLALVTPGEAVELHKISKSFFGRATANQRGIFYTPGAESDLQLVLPNRNPKESFFGTRITSMGIFGRHQPYLRLLRSNSDLTILAGIVRYNGQSKGPSGDALFVWLDGTLLDVKRDFPFSQCRSVAVYNRNVCCIFSGDSKADERDVYYNEISDTSSDRTKTSELRQVTWGTSSSRGIVEKVERAVHVGFQNSDCQLHPRIPVAIAISRETMSLQLIKLNLENDN